MKFAVIGLGAIGSIIGGLLTKSGEDVVLIGKKNQVETISKKGIRIDGLNGSIVVKDVHASTDLSLLGDVDVVIICVKSQDTQNLANDLKKYVNKSALLISLQNGIRNLKILRDTIGNKAVSGAILFNAFYTRPGEVELTIKGGLLLEAVDSSYDKVNRLVNSLKKEGLELEIVDDIEGYAWSKLIVNLQNALTALTGQTIRESIVDKDSRAIMIAIMNEGINILEKSGISLKTLPDIDPRKAIRRLSLFNSTILNIGSRLMKIKGHARTSMWQSLFRGKPTEIDYINGEIVTLARKNNLKAPINTKLVELVKKAEKTHSTKSFESSELKKLLNI
jgi:2-dehydropantoate 2-reductase